MKLKYKQQIQFIINSIYFLCIMLVGVLFIIPCNWLISDKSLKDEFTLWLGLSLIMSYGFEKIKEK